MWRKCEKGCTALNNVLLSNCQEKGVPNVRPAQHHPHRPHQPPCPCYLVHARHRPSPALLVRSLSCLGTAPFMLSLLWQSLGKWLSVLTICGDKVLGWLLTFSHLREISHLTDPQQTKSRTLVCLLSLLDWLYFSCSESRVWRSLHKTSTIFAGAKCGDSMNLNLTIAFGFLYVI